MDYEKAGTIAILIAGIIWLAATFKSMQKSHKETIEKLDELHRKERQQLSDENREDKKETIRAMNGFTEALTKIGIYIERMNK